MLSSAAEELKTLRTSIGLSQSALARLSGVPRWKINTFELGGGSLSGDESHMLRCVLQVQAQAQLDRLRNLPDHVGADPQNTGEVAAA
jgi:DNA-binding transcriptional regulator YiaG